LPKIQVEKFFTLFGKRTTRFRQFEKMLPMTAMKNDSKKNHYGGRGGFILCVFRTGSPANSAKVEAVGKIRVVQRAAQAEPEFLRECPTET
jgi:hypothetical protein